MIRALPLVALFAACSAVPLEVPDPPQGRIGQGPVDFVPAGKADILFLIDDTSPMAPMQAQLQRGFPAFFQALSDLAATSGATLDLNLGVVTSDFGAGALGAPGCTPSGVLGGGDQGKLQGLGRRAPATCFKPVGTNFLHVVFGDNVWSNAPAMQSLADTLGCMSAVGSQGCPFEHQLEAVYAAIHNNIPENQGNATDPGFLRDDAALMVLFLTNDDDGSAPPDTDIFDRTKVAQYGYFDTYSRKTRMGVMCGDPPAFPPYGDSHGPLDHCVAAPNPDGENGPGRLYDIHRYIDFFKAPLSQGGVKLDPLDVYLLGITGPEIPFQVILSDPATPVGRPLVPCVQLDESSTPPCVPMLQSSCVNGGQPQFNGSPAVRLNAVINSVVQHALVSVCENDYGVVLDMVVRMLASRVTDRCIVDAFPRDQNGQLVIDCIVEEQTIGADGSLSSVELPKCDATASVVPCWKVEARATCAARSPDGLGLTIERGVGPAPRHSVVTYECASLGP